MKVGIVHGRFQPFHNDHLDYIQLAQAECDFLWIGITQYNLHDLYIESSSHRSKVDNNPFTYAQRVEMIQAALLESGFDFGRFNFTPFPIDKPSQIEFFIPKSWICYTTIREDWNLRKIDTLKSQGFNVIVLKEDYDKRISGAQIRGLIKEGNPCWKEQVPESVANFITKHRY